ncbi:KTSC domain-containing protein [bacterium]|nr:KTSC domain-containing protein [bacterium]
MNQWLALLIAAVVAGLVSCRSMPAVTNVEPAPTFRLEQIGYQAETRTLTVLASDGVVYQHLNIPQRVYQRLLNASPQTEYYLHHIRGRYPLVKIRDARGR